jgi:hypothetical protein
VLSASPPTASVRDQLLLCAYLQPADPGRELVSESFSDLLDQLDTEATKSVSLATRG